MECALHMQLWPMVDVWHACHFQLTACATTSHTLISMSYMEEISAAYTLL